MKKQSNKLVMALFVSLLVLEVVFLGGKTQQIVLKEKEPDEAVALAYRYPAVPSIRFRTSSIKMMVGEERTMEAIVRPSEYEDEDLDWSSSNSRIVSVDSEGTLYANQVGTATITVKMWESKKTAKVKVTVKGVEAKKVTIQEDPFTMMVDEEVTLHAEVEPYDVTEPGVTWTSSNTKVATVDKRTGLIRAKKAGTTTIKATSKDGKRSDRIKVTVKSVPLETLSIGFSETTLKKGMTATLHATPSPRNADVGTITWTSNNSSVVSVGRTTGKITAKKGGSATITARSNKGVSTSVVVYVEDIPVERVELNTGDLTLQVKDTYSLRATVYPTNALNKSVKWSSSKTSVVSVSSTGRLVAKKAGTAVITATTEDGKKQAKITVTVEKEPVEDISFPHGTMELEVGDSYNLKSELLPTSMQNQDLEWKTENSSIVSVTSKGVIKAKKQGDCEITVRIKGTSKKTNIYVYVVDYDAPKLNMDSLALDIGEAETAILESPSGASVTWTSSNSRVASVNSRGKIVGKRAGKATITAKLKNGKKAQIKVEVRNRHTSNPEPADVFMTLVVGDIKELAIPGGIDYNHSTFESSNEEIVEIDERGYMTAVGTGEVDITIRNENGQERVVYVYVREIAVKRVRVSQSSITLYEGESERIDAWVEPVEASDTTLIWESSNEDVADVDDDGTIMAYQKGSATIRVYSHDRKKKATIRVRVRA